MVTTIILSACIPVTAAATGFFVLKAVQLGLRWQVETKQEKIPTMEAPKLPNPIAPMMEARAQAKEARQEQETATIFNEWVNGK